MANILVIAVHPDDETLGCGGTLLRHSAQGDALHWLIGTQLPKTHNYYATRCREIEQVAQQYGFSSVHQLPFLTTELDSYGMVRLVEAISSVIQEVQPEVIYLPFMGDIHSDHRIFFQAAYSCTKSFRHPFIKKVYMMEVLSETDFAPAIAENLFIPNVFVDISPFIDKKLEILACYKSEIQPPPFPRSLEVVRALATLRGSRAGCAYAEAFALLYECR